LQHLLQRLMEYLLQHLLQQHLLQHLLQQYLLQHLLQQYLLQHLLQQGFKLVLHHLNIFLMSYQLHPHHLHLHHDDANYSTYQQPN